MAAVRHKWFGTAQIIRREGDLIVIQYDKTGTKSNLKFPDSFITTPCLFVLDAELQREVDAIVEARDEEARILRAEKEAQRAAQREQEKVAQRPSASGTRRVGRTFVAVNRTGDIEKDFAHFLEVNGYSSITVHGTKSTVYSYVNSVKSIMEDDGLTWDSLEKAISSVVQLYDIGGAKEDIGYNSKSTVINALRRFEDFVNNSTP